ncbi:nucleotidyl transferase [Herbaspirillum sp. GW103]|nr:nucleotidyl transferase [Herbaspirillum sp. GW103]
MLDYWLASLLGQGVGPILLNTHYKAPLVAQYVEHSTWCPKVKLVYEERLLGTAGTVLANRDFFNDEAFLIAHADNLTRFDCGEFIAAHRCRPAGTALTMMLFEAQDPSACGIVERDESGVVQAFHEKVKNPPGRLANAAVYIVEQEVLDYMATLGKQEIDFSTEVIPHFMGRIFTFENTDYHRDIGTVKSWVAAQHDFGMLDACQENAMLWQRIVETLGPALPIMMNSLQQPDDALSGELNRY